MIRFARALHLYYLRYTDRTFQVKTYTVQNLLLTAYQDKNYGQDKCR
jgi:hypothetical protein